MVNEPTVSRINLNHVLPMKLLSPYRERNVHQFAGVGTAVEIIQRTPLLCRRLASALPGIVLVKQGSKVVRLALQTALSKRTTDPYLLKSEIRYIVAKQVRQPYGVVDEADDLSVASPQPGIAAALSAFWRCQVGIGRA
jgi:hypothetical protein